MTSGIRTTLRNWTMLLSSAALPLALACTAPAAAREPVAAATVDADWILARIARPGEARTRFVEVRSSKLLKNPLRVAGEYRRLAGDALVREVTSPYAETTTIQNGQATIQRGTSKRTFSLSRAPQLASMQSSFGALLRGDQTLLKQNFALSTSGPREQWTMVMTPKVAQLSQHVRAITLYGRGAELRCVETRVASGDEVQRTLLASAAAAAGSATTDAALQALCRGESR